MDVCGADRPGSPQGGQPLIAAAPAPVVLGIEVGPELLASWARWLAPDPQPFLVGPDAVWPACSDEGGALSKELEDTYRLWWGVERDSSVLWLSERQSDGLPRETRAALVREQVRRRRGAVPTVRAWQDVLDGPRLRASADGHRFVWWPSRLSGRAEEVLGRVVATGRLPSRHREVDGGTWRQAAAVLPAAERLAGTFPMGSTTNCFGSVMEAAGAPSAEVFGSVEPFEAWLASACVRGGDPARPGVVLVWRDRSGSPVHAAVTLGDGWGLEKPSRDWHSPFAVLTVPEIMRMSRHPGERVERHRIVGVSGR